jgi:hypothetical protein
MRLIRTLVAAAIIVAVPLLTTSSAGATINGPCTARGAINSKSYSATRKSVVIPRTGVVNWKGAIGTGSGNAVRDIEGKVYLKFPWPFGKTVIANGDWNSPSSRYANNGKYDYDLPSLLVGPKFTLSGHHAERRRVVCTGSVEVQLSGSKLKNPILLGSLALTVVALVNMGLVVRAKAVRP